MTSPLVGSLDLGEKFASFSVNKYPHSFGNELCSGLIQNSVDEKRIKR